MYARVNWGGIFRCEPDWRWDTITAPLPDFDLWAVFDGRGVFEAGDATVDLNSGDCLLLRPHEHYACRTDRDEPLLVHVIHFSFADGRGRAVTPDVVPNLYQPLVDQMLFRQLTTRAIDAHLANRPAEADDWLRVILHELARAQREREDRSRLDARARRIQQVCDDIANEPHKPWVVAELARRCFVSPDHFTRLFREIRGTTPRDFIMRQRIDAAKRLLLSSSHSIARIAELTGFSDIYHFSRRFKAATGRSPSRFRKVR